MLAFLRRRLQMIRYYSASRPRTIWSRAGDAALIGGLALALPAAWIADASFVQSTPIAALDGGLSSANGVLVARLVTEEQPSFTALPGERQVGSFTLTMLEQRQGWPLTGTVRPAVTLRMRHFAEPEARANEPLDHASPEQTAIAEAVRRAGRHDFHSVWWDEHSPVSRHIGAWAANAGFWWMAVTLGGWMTIGALAGAMHLRTWAHRARAAKRRAAGCCIACGYDLTGLEFSERCPECGEVAA